LPSLICGFLRKGISVIIPAKNESENILPLHAVVSSVLKRLGLDYELIFINDGSTDSSLEKMLAAKKKDSKVKVIDLRRNCGQSAAIAGRL